MMLQPFAAEWLVLKQRQPRAASDRLQIGKREAARKGGPWKQWEQA